MPYRGSNYQFVIDSSFRPFEMSEMLVPFTAYKEAFEKSEEAYNELRKGADKFSYLAKNLDPDSEAAQIYNGYANDLRMQAEDLASNGLTMGNRRALTGLKQRYQGEIGRLEEAKTALDKELALRREMNAKDPSILYGANNLTIDNFLDNSRPNLYSISGNELYTRGAQRGRALSSRIFDESEPEGNILGGYYKTLKEKHGIPEVAIGELMKTKEFNDMVDAAMAERGVADNLSGRDYERARQSFIEGIYDGIIYEEKNNIQRDLGKPSWSEKDTSDRGWASFNESKRQFNMGLRMRGFDENGIYHPELDQEAAKAGAIARAKTEGKAASGGGRSGAAYDVRNKETAIVGAKTGTVYKSPGAEGDGKELDEMPMRALTAQEYAKLVDSYGNITNEYIRNAVGNGYLSDYEIYIVPSGSTEISGTGWIDNDDLDEDIYILKPRESKRSATDSGIGAGVSVDSGTNDIPE